MVKSIQKNDKIEVKAHGLKRSLGVMNLIFHSLKGFFKSFEERSVQKYFFHDYFKTNRVAGSNVNAKMFHRTYKKSKNYV